MKKLIAILMIAFMAVFAMAGDGVNDFKNPLGSSFVPASTDRIHFLDVSEFGTTGALGKEYVTWLWFTAQFSGSVEVDSLTIVADASAAVLKVTIPPKKLLTFVGLYPGGTWDTTDFLEFNDADSNATTIDTMNLSISAWKTEGAFTIYNDKAVDSLIYINQGDTTSTTATAYVKYTIQ